MSKDAYAKAMAALPKIECPKCGNARYPGFPAYCPCCEPARPPAKPDFRSMPIDEAKAALLKEMFE
jgi:hypothetical protein